MASVSDIRRTFLEYFRKQRPRGRGLEPAGAAQRPDVDVHQRRHGAVQERLHRPREAALHARRDARRSACAPAASTTTSRTSATPRATTPSSRCWATSRSATTSRSDAIELAWNLITKEYGLPKDQLLVTVFQRRTTRRRATGRRSPGFSDEQDHPHPDLGQFLGDGRHRPVRAVLGDLLRPRRGHPRRPAGQPRPGRRPLHRDLEPGLHAVRAGDARTSASAAQAVDRHRHGAGAHRRRPAGQAQQLRHRPVPRPDRGGGARDRRRSRRRRSRRRTR